MIEKAKLFWNWFSENNKAYLFLNEIENDVKEELLQTFMKNLHAYCDKLYFEIGGFPGGDQELIITAEGNRDYFEQVETLIAEAPEIRGWTFIAFIQPREIDFKMDYEGVVLKAEEMWFLPLHNPKNSNGIGIRVCTMNYELIKDHKWLKSALYKSLDTILGEKSFALDIDYIDIAQLPDDPEQMGMIPLSQLPEYVEWKKSKRSN